VGGHDRGEGGRIGKEGRLGAREEGSTACPIRRKGAYGLPCGEDLGCLSQQEGIK